MSFDDLLFHEPPPLVTVEENSVNPGQSDPRPRNWSFYPQTDKSTKGKEDYRFEVYALCVPNSCLFSFVVSGRISRRDAAIREDSSSSGWLIDECFVQNLECLY